MAKKFNFTTVKEMKTDALLKVGLLLLLALVCIGGGLAAMSKEGAGKGLIAFGLVLAFGGGGGSGYKAYTMIVDPKNAKTCNTDYWTVYDCVANPAGTDADNELNIDLCKAQTNAQYKGYAGVWLTPNTASTGTTGNFDAFYISGDKQTVPLTTGTSGNKVYLRKAKADGDDDKGVSATGAINGCVSKSLGTVTISSPSSSGFTVKMSSITGFNDTDTITLTINRTTSPPTSPTPSPITTSATVTTLKSANGFTYTPSPTGQTLLAGSYTVTASFSGVSSVTSNSFTV